MASPWRDGDREELERELHTSKYQELLRRLQMAEPCMRGFGRWLDVVGFMRTGSASDPRTDMVLRPILGAYSEDRDGRWLAILALLVWHELEAIARWKAHWDDNPDELWANIVATFLSVASRLDVSRRPARLGQKLRNDVIHHVHAGYARRWARGHCELGVDPDELAEFGGSAVPDLDEAIDLRAGHERRLSELRGHRDTGRVSEADYLLLVGTKLYGKSIAEYAREAGLDYGTLRKRCWRLEAKLRRFEDAMR